MEMKKYLEKSKLTEAPPAYSPSLRCRVTALAFFVIFLITGIFAGMMIGNEKDSAPSRHNLASANLVKETD